ncbi:hypothetical protein CWATWH8502_3453 [Crocosphaera watsonii WH 8502]|uniref:Uncharacterized protein n=5 Tax=Crocosphaera watsonii TaxID=263511 RepID=T2JQ27_CROWT|nr:hypothetical protein CWATWH0003_1011 [Crocosphaera watsonii WH 0003]CCQ53081.1 hypothetical protein CWATWH8502_3453 [Crocosphaera watsonii WH 8502]CCQ57479.1 hypothetical protein CWATWH0005_2111 [Crocosphaera watsonii WH 0005]CCQ60523.1 hypothetical protein CWATWH0401_2193 [Crocosphaera watsonii WH 0401]CCQ67164.1 hypothetical protein CWATWH0402_6380 [Crocosphaera watsonii WH 0402]
MTPTVFLSLVTYPKAKIKKIVIIFDGFLFSKLEWKKLHT